MKSNPQKCEEGRFGPPAKLWLGLAFLFLAGCHDPQATSSPSRVPIATPSPPRHGLLGEVIAPDGAQATGRLLLTWRTADEDREAARGHLTLAMIRRMIDRMNVSAADVDLGKTPRVLYDLPSAPTDAVPVAIFDVDHTFWATFQGRGKGFVATGAPGGGPLKLAPNPVAPDPPRERCEGDRYKLVVIDGATAQIGQRRFCAYLPPSWKSEPRRRYPVVLLLPGFGSNETVYLTGGRHAGERLDAISNELSREAVLVGVDTSVPLGSTYLEDSPVIGAWDTFLANKVLPILDRDLRLIPRRTARALLGHSTGGYNALSFGMRHSDLFSAIGASSPDAPDVEKYLLEPGTRRAREWLRNWAHLEAAVGGAGQMTSWAANWSPDASAPRGFRYPIDVDSGVADETVLAQWVAKTPHGLVRDPAFLARVKNDLSGRILVIVGRNDDFDLFAPRRELRAGAQRSRRRDAVRRDRPRSRKSPRALRTGDALPPREARPRAIVEEIILFVPIVDAR